MSSEEALQEEGNEHQQLHEQVCDLHNKADIAMMTNEDTFLIIDEMAVLFRHAYVLLDMMGWLLANGWQFAGMDMDEVSTEPISSKYEVMYIWLTHPDFNWRYELMAIRNGFSPLHKAALADPEMPYAIPIHASFKCSGLSEYLNVKSAMYGYQEEVQECTSSYGRFSYFKDPNLPEKLYLKPRVNLRDTVLGTSA